MFRDADGASYTYADMIALIAKGPHPLPTGTHGAVIDLLDRLTAVPEHEEAALPAACGGSAGPGKERGADRRVAGGDVAGGKTTAADPFCDPTLRIVRRDRVCSVTRLNSHTYQRRLDPADADVWLDTSQRALAASGPGIVRSCSSCAYGWAVSSTATFAGSRTPWPGAADPCFDRTTWRAGMLGRPC